MSSTEDPTREPDEARSSEIGPPRRLEPSRRLRKPFRYDLEAYTLLGLLIGAAIFFSVWSKTSATFPTAANIQSIIAGSAVVAMVSLGALIPLVCYEFDLSVGAITGLSATYVATVLSHGGGIPLAILTGVGIGLEVVPGSVEVEAAVLPPSSAPVGSV